MYDAQSILSAARRLSVARRGENDQAYSQNHFPERNVMVQNKTYVSALPRKEVISLGWYILGVVVSIGIKLIEDELDH